MGAEGVSMGTRFLATREAPVHENLKQELVEANELETQLILRKFRNTARIHKNTVARKIAEIESQHGTEFSDIAKLASGERGFHVLESGDMEYGIWWSGISQALIYDVPTVAELITRMVVEAETIINERLAGLLG
jgi:nitronate monooxygenase